MSGWIPTGRLKDGTCLFGPLKDKPTDLGRYVEGEINGVPWYVVHSGGELSPEQFSELKTWAEKTISDRAR